MKKLSRILGFSFGLLLLGLAPIAKSDTQGNSNLGLTTSGSGATMVFERVTDLEINTGGSMTIGNKNLQRAVIRAIDVAKAHPKAAFDACERSARTAMAFPDKYQLSVYGYSFDNNSTATTSIIYTPAVGDTSAGTPSFYCVLSLKAK